MKRPPITFAQSLITCFVVVAVLSLLAIVEISRFLMAPHTWLHYQLGGILRTTPPSLSPDKTRLVMTDPTSGNGDIAVLLLATGQKRSLIATPRFEANPVFVNNNELLFTRESGMNRHVFRFDLRTQREMQITTAPGVYDILDIDRQSGRVLVLNESRSIGRDKGSRPQLVSMSGAEAISADLGNFAQFTSDGGIVYSIYHDQTTHLLSNTDSTPHLVTSGVIQAVSKYNPMLIVADPWEYTTECNQRLVVVDCISGERKILGEAHSVTFVAPDKVLGFIGYQQSAFTYDVKSGTLHMIESPDGVKEPASPTDDGHTAYVWIHLPNNIGEAIYGFDAVTEKFSEIVAFPTSTKVK